MSLSAIRGFTKLTRLLPSTRPLLSSSASVCFRDSTPNARTIARSLFYFSRSRDSTPKNVCTSALSVPWSNMCRCGCGIHSKGDKELAAFLEEEISNESKSQTTILPELGDFNCKYEGSEVVLLRRLNNEYITIKSNVNHSVDAEETVGDPSDDKEPEMGEMRSKPDFTVEVKKGEKILSFECSFTDAMSEEEQTESYSDAFQITEIALYEGDMKDSTYSVSGEIMDGYLYDLLMNYLEERGVSNEFVDKMMAFFTSYEHKLYVSLLQGMKRFVEQ